MRAALVLAAVLLAGPLTAQDMPPPSGPAAADLAADAALLERCLGDADAPESCIGSVGAPCLGRAGGAADAVAACHAREQAVWQARLDDVLARLRDDAAAADTVAGQSAPPPGTLPDMPPATPSDSRALPAIAPLPRLVALERAQSAWIAWRDAECAWHASGFDPQAAAAALSECRMTLAARRVLTLEPQGRAVDGP